MKNTFTYTLFLLCMSTSFQTNAQIQYPKTEKGNVVDTYFDLSVADPYRWLEDDTAKKVEQWVDAQNATTDAYMSQIPYVDKIKARFAELYNFPKFGEPFKAGKYYIFSKNSGLQNQSVYYIQEGLQGTPKVLLDPNTLSKDGTITADFAGISKDKKYVTISKSASGSDWEEFEVMEIATGKMLADKLKWVKFSGAAWFKNGFYYNRYDEPVKGKEFSNTNQYLKIYYHTLGQPQAKDALVYEDKTHPLRFFSISNTEDESFSVLSISEGTDGNELHVKNLSKGDKNFSLLCKGFAFNYTVIDNSGEKLLVLTNDGAPNYRLVSIDPKQPESKNWKTIIPEKPHLLQSVSKAGGKLFAQYLENVSTHVYQFTYDGKLDREITFPTLGSAFGFSGEKDDEEVFYTFTSFTIPPVIYKYNLKTGKSELFKKTEVKFNPEDFEVNQVWYPSKDGTKVPMFLVHKKGLEKNGKNPTLLYGYGGFNISLTPNFSTSNLILLEKGGIYALANLRGGGEFGEKWHEGGMLLKKQNVFDDFIAAGEYLIKEGYTSKDFLAIEGGSNGGLLVGACMTQRPDLYKVAFPNVGVLDMMRFHKFTIGWGWVVEYGSSDSAKHYKNLAKYSPLHNVKEVAYPSTLVGTADHDDRVVPAHSFKFIATLQEKHQGKNPVLIRISKKAGHGAGKPTSKVIQEQAVKWAFMFHEMGIAY